MINVYLSILNDEGKQVKGRTKLFIKTQENGNIEEYISGIACVPEGSGTMFIVDDWLIDQLDKVVFVDGALYVKEGAEPKAPIKSEKQLRIEELQREMAELQAMPDDLADTEESLQLININTADYDALMTLTSVGEAKANAIIDYRTENGAFIVPEDIMKVSGIGQGLYDGLKNEITV